MLIGNLVITVSLCNLHALVIELTMIKELSALYLMMDNVCLIADMYERKVVDLIPCSTRCAQKRDVCISQFLGILSSFIRKLLKCLHMDK